MRVVTYHHTAQEIEAARTDPVIETTEEYNELFDNIKKDNGWFDKFIGLCKYYYEGNPCGGLLHIVLDDGNLEDTHIAWCEGLAYGWSDHQAMDIAALMMAMSMEQRQRVYEAL